MRRLKVSIISTLISLTAISAILPHHTSAQPIGSPGAVLKGTPPGGGGGACVAAGLTGYLASDGTLYTCVSSVWTSLGAGGSAVWGAITGTLSNQTDLVAALALKASLASPDLTGNPTAPTQSAGNSSTRLATTAFVAGAVPSAAAPYLTIGSSTYGPLMLLSAPPASGWSWLNQGSSTVTTINSSLAFSFTANLGNDNARCYMRNLPASTGYTADIAMLSVSHAIGAGISDGTKLILVWQQGGGNVTAFDFNSTTSVGSAYFTAVTSLGQTAPLWWIRFLDAGSARHVKICADPDTCTDINSQASGTFLTETMYGICYETNQTPAGLAKLVHVSATTP